MKLETITFLKVNVVSCNFISTKPQTKSAILIVKAVKIDNANERVAIYAKAVKVGTWLVTKHKNSRRAKPRPPST